MKDVGELTFEEALGKLEGTVQQLEEGELTLEEAINLYELGMSLAQRCNEALDAAELQIQKLAAADRQPALPTFLEEEAE